jgi:type IV fimbrial biogenesis protein FimT
MLYSFKPCTTRQAGFTQSGFTLVELMVTLIIAAIMVTMAIPSFTATIQNNRATAQINEFVSTLNLARTEAIKRGARVTVCKSPDATNCYTSTTGWEQGWIVFVDSDADDTHDSSETILLTSEGLAAGTTLTGAAGADVNNYVSYRPSGKTTFPINGGEVALILCDSRNDESRMKAITVAPTGRVSSNPAVSSSLSCSS